MPRPPLSSDCHPRGHRNAEHERLVYQQDHDAQMDGDRQTRRTKSGCGTVAVPDTTGTTYMCSATNSAGSASNSVIIKKDSVKPTVTITTPVNGASYALGSTVLAAYACSDATSGIDTCSGTVPDGGTIKTGSAGTRSSP